jgi:pimeloyl-ACP methyl ester carboxylesterase
MRLVPPICPEGIEERWVTLDGYRIRYLCGGSGTPLLLIHGLLGYSFSWRQSLADLARRATVYAPDLPGLGFSDRSPSFDCGLQATAERLLGFMRAAGLREAHLLGTSHGGGIAIKLASLCVEQASPSVRSLILAAPVNPWSPQGSGIARVLGNPLMSPLVRGLFPVLKHSGPFWLKRMCGDTSRLQPGTLEGYVSALAVPGTMRHVLRIAAGWERDLEEIQHAIARLRNVPTLLIWGTADRAVTPRSAEPLRSNFARAELVLLEGVGHLPYEEAPAEFSRAVCDFLSRVSAGARTTASNS